MAESKIAKKVVKLTNAIDKMVLNVKNDVQKIEKAIEELKESTKKTGGN